MTRFLIDIELDGYDDYEEMLNSLNEGDVWNIKSELVYGEEITLYCVSYMNFPNQDTND